MTNGDERDEPTEEGAEVPAQRPSKGEPAGQRSGGKGRPAGGDDWDDWDEDDDWDGGGSSKPLDMRVLAVIIAAIIVVISVIFFMSNGDDDGGEQSGGGGEGNGQEVGPCGTGDWEWGFGGSVEGVGKRMAAGETGVFVWNDFEGVHVRSNLGTPVTVKLTGDDAFDVKTAGEGASASADSGSEVSFELPASDGSSGPDLDIKCLRSLTIDARSGEAPLPTEQLLFGDDKVSDANPSTFRRPE